VEETEKGSGKKIPYQALIDAFTSQIAILDHGNVIIAVNSAWQKRLAEKITGLVNSKVGENYLNACKKAAKKEIEGASKVVEAIEYIQKGECLEKIIEYSETGSLSKQWFQVKISKFLYDEGRLIVIHQNITERKAAEQNLHENERLFRGIVDQASEGISIIDEEGRIIEWNQAVENITGKSRASVLGRYLWEVQYEIRAGKVTPQIKDLMQKMVIDLLKTGQTKWIGKPNEVEIIKPDGSLSIIESVVFPIPHNGGYYACSLTRDVTQLRRSYQEQEILSTKLENYVDYSPVIAFIVTKEGKFVDVNPGACKNLGYSKEEFLKMSITDLIFQEDLESLTALLNRLQSERSITVEFRIKRKDKKILTFSANAVVLPDGNSMILCNDITDLKDSQTKLQESESFLNTILDNIPSAITVKDAKNLTYHKINALMEKMLGMTNEVVMGKTAQDIFPKEEAALYEEQDRLIVENESFVETQRITSTRESFEGHTLNHKKVPILDESGKPKYVLTISDDVTNQVKLEAEAKAYLTRLESISKLSTSLQTIPDLSSLMPIFLNITMPVVSAEMGCVWLLKTEKNELVPAYSIINDYGTDLMDFGTVRTGEGIPGQVLSELTQIFTNDYGSDSWFSKVKNKLPEGSYGGVTLPLKTADAILGVVNFTFKSERIVTDEDVRLLTTLSEIAANGIQNLTLKAQTEQRLTRLAAASSIDRAISSSFDLQVSLEILTSNVIAQLKVDACTVLLFNPVLKMLEYAAGQGFQVADIRDTSLKPGQNLAGRAALSRESVYVRDLKEYPEEFMTAGLEEEGFTSYYGVPLISKGELKGVLEVFHRTLLEPDDDWINFLNSLAEQAAIAIDNTQMFQNLHRSNLELTMAYNATIEGWSRALDLRDKETEGHTLRVTEMTERLAKAFNIPDNQLKYIRWGSLLHDIGKLGVPDGILLKPGPLTDEEWQIMRLHPKYAFEMLSPIGYLKDAIDIPYCHHEKWDGSGYPRGIKGEEIPLAARLFAIVDIWDALHSDRPYRNAWPTEKILEYLASISGSHLDPMIVDFCLKSGIFNRDLEG